MDNGRVVRYSVPGFNIQALLFWLAIAAVILFPFHSEFALHRWFDCVGLGYIFTKCSTKAEYCFISIAHCLMTYIVGDILVQFISFVYSTTVQSK
jgi:hypothetical protein